MFPSRTQITGLTGTYAGRSALLQQDRVTIGREQTNGMSFALDLTLSRNHAELIASQSGWYVRDLESTNGTYVNDQRLPRGGMQRLESGSIVRCGAQTFRLDWQDEVIPPPILVPPQTPVPIRASISLPPPVAIPIPAPPPVAAVAAPPRQASPRTEPRPRTYQWASPGQPLVIQGRRIACGLFYVGSGMKDAMGYGIEPALIDPSLSTSESDSEPQADGYFLSYKELSPRSRARFLDWLAAGRPGVEMTDADGLLFLAGLERHHLANPDSQKPSLGDSANELRRLLESAPADSEAAAKFRAFLLTVGAETIAIPDEPFDRSIVEELSSKDPYPLQIRLVARTSRSSTLNPYEALAAIAFDQETYPRTPFRRCLPEVAEVFTELVSRRYPKGVNVRTLSSGHEHNYTPANRWISSSHRALPKLKGYRIAQQTLGHLREFLTQSTDALDSYSRRIGTRPDEAGKLPAICLLPPTLAASQSVFQELAHICSAACESQGQLKVGEIAKHWVNWPEGGALSKAERDLLHRSLWLSGYIAEPNVATGAPISVDSSVFIAKREPHSQLEPSSELSNTYPLVAIAATVILADGTLHEKEREHAKERLASLVHLEKEEARRLALYVDWLLSSELPKISKKAFESVLPDQKRPFITFLAEVAAIDGSVDPAEVKEIVRIAKVLGIPEEEVYPLLHQAASHDRRIAPPTHSQELDMTLIQQKLNQTEAASQLLGSVFAGEEEDSVPPATPVVFDEADEANLPQTDDPLRKVVSELTATATWSEADFCALASRFEKLPNALYETLNDVAYDAVGDPLLEGDNPITVNLEVAEELLK